MFVAQEGETDEAESSDFDENEEISTTNKRHAKELAAKDRCIAGLKGKLVKLYTSTADTISLLREQIKTNKEEYRLNLREMGGRCNEQTRST